MRKRRLPPYATVIGAGTEIFGEIRFQGGLHIDGRVVGDISAGSDNGCALTLGASGVIEGNLSVPHVIIDGTVVGDVRAGHRAELASGARIRGTLHYGALEMDEGAEVNGKLLHVDDAETLRLEFRGADTDPGGAPPGRHDPDASGSP